MTLEFTPEKTRIGWIGTGVMGSSMCGHLVAAGYRASVYNRSAEKTRPLVEKGAKPLDSPRAVAQASDVVFTIVGYPKDVREVTLGENGILGGAKPGVVLVDMTTSEPALAVEIDQAARAKGVHSVDAPVSGGDVGAGRRGCRSWPAVRSRSSMPSCRFSRRWARRSCTKGPPERASIRRW